MPRSSTTSLSQETINELENQFFNFLDSLSYEEKKQFFGEFLTNEEKMMMYKRLALYWCLLEGYPLARIQQMIGVTHDTTRVYNKKKNLLSSEFKSLIKRISPSQAPQEHPQEQQEEPQIQEMSQTQEPERREEMHEESPFQSEPTQETSQQTDEMPQEQPQMEAQNIWNETDNQEEQVKPEEQFGTAHVEEDETRHETHEQELVHPMESLQEETNEMDTHQKNEDEPQQQEITMSTDTTSQESASSEENKEEEDEGKEKKKGWGKFFGF